MIKQTPKGARYFGLTEREREVLILICEGLSRKDIAFRLGITTNTVDFHRAKILEHWEVTNTTMLIRKAIRMGVIQA